MALRLHRVTDDTWQRLANARRAQDHLEAAAYQRLIIGDHHGRPVRLAGLGRRGRLGMVGVPGKS